MPDTHCTLDMLGVPVPVLVSWCVSRDGSEYSPEIEIVVSDVLGDITDKVLNDVCGDGFWLTRAGGPLIWPRPAWVPYDPLLAVVFGQCFIYERGDDRIRPESQPYDHPVKWGSEGGRMMGARQQHERTVPVLRAYGTMAHRLMGEIEAGDQWWDAVADYEAWLSEVD
jgi:hypothetical protein